MSSSPNTAFSPSCSLSSRHSASAQPPHQPQSKLRTSLSILILHLGLRRFVLSHVKQWFGIDHDESPRYDLDQYGTDAARSGNITEKQLDMSGRNESAHASSVESYLSERLGLLFINNFASMFINSYNISFSQTRLVHYRCARIFSATSLSTNFLIFPLPVSGTSASQSSPNQKICTGALCLPKTFLTQFCTSAKSGWSVPASWRRKAAGTST